MVSLSPARAAAAQAVADALSMPVDMFAVSTPPKANMGDLAVGCFPAAKEKKAAPNKLAAEAAEAFVPSEFLSSAQAAGPYVNFRINRAALYRHVLTSALGDGSIISQAVGANQTVCIDYSSPNIAKHLAYHHIRSTVIGQALCNIHRALGYRVVGINHLGDWGTTHGMLLCAYHMWSDDAPLSVDKLNRLYVRFRAEMKEDPTLEEKGREWFKKLEDGDSDARALWAKFREVSLAEFALIYDLLGVQFDEVRGESAYENDMDPVIDMLADKKLSSMSDGALVVDLEADNMPPLLLRKGDGATLYATRDLAAALYRAKTYSFDRSLYVVDRGQSLHFRQLFRVLDMAGFQWSKQMQHVAFGLVRFGGKKTGTRTGNVVLLRDVLAEAQEQIQERLKDSDLDANLAKQVARDVGVGAIIFAGLSTQREKDFDFSWDQILSFEGDAGPYVQYAHARTASVLGKGQVDDPAGLVDADVDLLDGEEEWALAKRLTDLPDEVRRAATSCEPHIVAQYLLDLCSCFSRWYTTGNQDRARRILVDDVQTARARLALTAATQTTLATGLRLLGMAAPQKM